MDSPHLQSLSQPQRVRTNSNLSVHSLDQSGGIRKRSLERSRSVSTTQADRLHQLALEQSTQVEVIPAASGIQWITPQHSPQTQAIFPEQSIEPFPTWGVPTPPRSDSGVPTLAIDTAEDPVTGGITTSQGFQFEQPTTSAEMSSLGFLLPSQYGSSLYESEPSSYAMDQNYIPPMKVSQPTSTSGSSGYAQTISSSPALYQSRTVPESSASSRRHSEFPSNTPDQSYGQSYRRVSSPYGNSTANPYSSASGPTIPSISGITQSPLPSPHMSSSSASGSMPQYHTSLSRSVAQGLDTGPLTMLTSDRSPAMSYDSGMYQQPYSTSPGTSQMYAHSDSMSYPPPFVGSSVNQVLAKPLGSDSSIRVLNQRPKPQCWEHGCNGRQFSTFSNLLRHQREKSGTASKSYCPKCGAEFTRTTARNGHLAHDKCSKQQRRESEDDK